jgi:hypothetical protein
MAKVSVNITDEDKARNSGITVSYEGNFPQPESLTYTAARKWISNASTVKTDGSQEYKQRFLTVVPLGVYKACPEKKVKETSEETKVQESEKPAPAVYEIGSEFIGELKLLQTVITHTR